MSVTIRARFDGKVLVPEDPVYLPLHQLLNLEWKSSGDTLPSLNKQEHAHAALQRLLTRAVQGAAISDEALRRENLYEERQ